MVDESKPPGTPPRRIDARGGSITEAFDIQGFKGSVDDFRTKKLRMGARFWEALPPSPFKCDFRLTLTHDTPVTTADVTAATTLYVAPAVGSQIVLHDGNDWDLFESGEVSRPLPTVANKVYDIFAYWDAGILAFEFVEWTSDLVRATLLTYQNGVLVKLGDPRKRYLGSIRTTGVAGQCEDSFAKRYCWNYYNRRRRAMRAIDSTNSWTYTEATLRQARASAANQLDFVLGVPEDAVTAEVLAMASNGSAPTASVGIGLNSTTTNAPGFLAPLVVLSSAVQPLMASWKGYPTAGRNYLAWLEQSLAVGTTTWRGDFADPALYQAGIHGEIWG